MFIEGYRTPGKERFYRLESLTQAVHIVDNGEAPAELVRGNNLFGITLCKRYEMIKADLKAAGLLCE